MKNIVIFASVAVAFVIAVAVFYVGGYSLSPAQNPGANATETTTQELKLISIIALDKSRSMIGPLTENQTFKVNNAVYLQANFSSPNIDSSEHAVVSEVSGPAGTSALSNVQATLGGSGQLSLETYWKPDQLGDYTFLLFQDLPDMPYDTEITQPLARITLHVVE